MDKDGLAAQERFDWAVCPSAATKGSAPATDKSAEWPPNGGGDLWLLGAAAPEWAAMWPLAALPRSAPNAAACCGWLFVPFATRREPDRNGTGADKWPLETDEEWGADWAKGTVDWRERWALPPRCCCCCCCWCC